MGAFPQNIFLPHPQIIPDVLKLDQICWFRQKNGIFFTFFAFSFLPPKNNAGNATGLPYFISL